MTVEKKYITSDELKEHNKPGDLWISIQGKTYNVTNWAQIHPGGDTPLLSLAGQDATDAFIAYHPGTPWKHLDHNNLFTGCHLKDFPVSKVSKDYRNLASEFSKSGLFDNKGHVTFWTLTSVAVMFLVVLYGVLRCTSVWAHLGSASLLGLLWMQSAYVGHDSGHYQVMETRNYNKLAQIISGNCLTGISIAWWKWTHNAHHIACNSLDHDPDLQHIPVFAVSSRFFNSITSSFYGRKLNFNPLARFFISYQHWYFYPVMCIARINLFVQTLVLLFSKRKVPDRGFNIMGILVFWIWFPLLVSSLPNWAERVMYVMVSFAVTSIQHVQFCLNHFSGNLYVGPPSGVEWFEKQTRGTLDIASWCWMDSFFGGLQFQIEHHLFPRLPRCQLRKVSPLVRELCEKHDLPYRSLTFWEANRWTIRTLRTAAMQARQIRDSVPENLFWEAVNAYGC